MAWIVVIVGGLFVVAQIWQDRVQYPRFKAMTEGASRQRMFRYWTLDALVRYGLLGVGGLWLLGRQDSLYRMPDDVANAISLATVRLHLDPRLFATLGTGISAGLCFGMLIVSILPLLPRARASRSSLLAGDIAALIPRTPTEIRWGAALSLNAGVTEEIFFRLLMPLAWYAITQDVLLSFLIAAVIFGMVHSYQGIVGVLATFGIGVALTLLYIATRQIWVVMLLHALIDLRAMVILPLTLQRM